MRAIESDGEVEEFRPFEFAGWTVPPVKDGHSLVRVAAYVQDRQYGLMFIFKRDEPEPDHEPDFDESIEWDDASQGANQMEAMYGGDDGFFD